MWKHEEWWTYADFCEAAMGALELLAVFAFVITAIIVIASWVW